MRVRCAASAVQTAASVAAAAAAMTSSSLRDCRRFSSVPYVQHMKAKQKNGEFTENGGTIL